MSSSVGARAFWAFGLPRLLHERTAQPGAGFLNPRAQSYRLLVLAKQQLSFSFGGLKHAAGW